MCNKKIQNQVNFLKLWYCILRSVILIGQELINFGQEHINFLCVVLIFIQNVCTVNVHEIKNL
jgi:hypothetical protein